MLRTYYNIQCVTQKVIKGIVLSDYLTHQPVEGYQLIKFDFPDEGICSLETAIFQAHMKDPNQEHEGTLVFGDASNPKSHGIWAIITSPTGFHIPFTAGLYFDCTNNMAEYEAYIYGIEANINLKIKILEVFVDPALVIS